MGLPPSDIMPAHCACGRQLTEMDQDTQVSHFRGCPYQKRIGIDMRCGFVRDALVAILIEFSTPCLSEDHYREDDWPDVEIFFSPCPSLLVPRAICIVAVTCPTTVSLLKKSIHAVIKSVTHARRQNQQIQTPRSGCRSDCGDITASCDVCVFFMVA